MGEMSRTIRTQNLRLVLRVDSGLALGAVYSLNQFRTILGRRVDATVPVDDSKTSRNHAALDLQNGFYYLVDLGSTNGTYHNEKRVEAAVQVTVGDRIRIGSTIFVLELLEKAKRQALQPWHEPTRVIMQPDMFQKAKMPELMPEESQHNLPRWYFLSDKALKKLPPERARWILGGLCGALVLAAIATRFSQIF